MADPLTDAQEVPLKRLPRTPRRPIPTYTDILIPGVAVAPGAMLGCGLPDLIGAEGWGDYASVR